MSTLNGGPGIVTDGLILYLDVANPYSYVSGSTVWNDISRVGNNVTLLNGPAYTSANGGSLIFDGVNDYGALNTQIFYNIANPEFTLSFVCKTDTTNPQRLYSEGNNTVPVGRVFFGVNLTGKIDLGLGDFNLAGGTITPSPDLILNINEWTNLTVTNKGATTVFYKNGVVWSTVTHNIQSSSPITVGESRIGRVYGTGAEYFDGSIPIAQIYNRALTAQEVLQNYNAHKSRFGL